LIVLDEARARARVAAEKLNRVHSIDLPAVRITPDCHWLSALAFCRRLAQFASSNFKR
jgi:hypothetical protein